jgi:hypothetical protein
MLSKFPAAAVFSLVVVFGATAFAEKKGAKKDVLPESINRQFEWEEKVIGPSGDKKIDHERIAAMREEGKRQERLEAARREEERKRERTDGLQEPANSVLPTMDIEKPAPAAASTPRRPKPPKVEEPRRRDSLDNLLAEEDRSTSPGKSGSDGLNQLLATEEKPKVRAQARGSSRAHPRAGNGRLHKAKRHKHHRSRRGRS